MSTTYHTPIVNGASNDASTWNTPMGQLDAAIAAAQAARVAGDTSLQDEIDALIIDSGTSDAETIAARTAINYLAGSPPDTLGDALALAAGNLHNVMAYGAVGDGVTNDAAAINAAFAAAGPGDTVLFPPGYTYVVNSGLSLATAGVRVSGYGATIDARSVASDANLLLVEGDGTIIEGLTINGPSTVGSAEGDRGGRQRGIRLAAEYCTVRDCTITGFWMAGIQVALGHAKVVNNTLIGVRHRTAADHWGAIQLASTGDCLVSGNHVLDFYDSGISSYMGNRNVITGNYVRGSLDAGASGTMGIRLIGPSAHCIIANNYVQDIYNEGIVIAPGEAGATTAHHSINGNIVRNTLFAGIRLFGNQGTVGGETYIRHVSVMGNVIDATGLVGGSMDAGIWLASIDASSVITETSVIGNTIRGTGTTLPYGIRLNGAGVGRSSINHNIIEGASTEGIAVQGNDSMCIGNLVNGCAIGIRGSFFVRGIMSHNRVINSTTKSITIDNGLAAARITDNMIDLKLDNLATGSPMLRSNTVQALIYAGGPVTLNGINAVLVNASGVHPNGGDGGVVLYRASDGATGTPGQIYVSKIEHSASRFYVKSTSSDDTGTFFWEVVR